jgi:hypothetical protein
MKLGKRLFEYGDSSDTESSIHVAANRVKSFPVILEGGSVWKYIEKSQIACGKILGYTRVQEEVD